MDFPYFAKISCLRSGIKYSAILQKIFWLITIVLSALYARRAKSGAKIEKIPDNPKEILKENYIILRRLKMNITPTISRTIKPRIASQANLNCIPGRFTFIP